MKMAGSLSEDGVVVGNTYDKYGSRNPIVKWMMSGFSGALQEFVARANPSTINEVGCGEGFWVTQWQQQGLQARGCDFSTQVIELARSNTQSQGLPAGLFSVRSIYDLEAPRDCADLVVCCEVLEHLEEPDRALGVLRGVVQNGWAIFSVPDEPLWRVLNVARGKYIGALGNTPGHIQHWSKSGFVNLIGRYFDVIEVRSPHPWTMLLARGRAAHARPS